jgi:transglutaminase-like putative cysteine protease
MRLQIIHDTRYDYASPVKTAHHMAHMRPREEAWQQLRSHALEITPAPPRRTEDFDVYGNPRTFFSLQGAHDALRIVARSLVETAEPPRVPVGAGESPGWQAVAEAMRFEAGGRWDPAAEFTFASEFAPYHPDFDDYARPSFAPGTAVLAGAHDLMRRIHREFRYDTDSTEVETPAVAALAQRRGVCQDFAHIMIACLRALGLPARYASGYLLTYPPPGKPRLIGSDASHAWVQVYAPAADGGPGAWHGFDPTNDRAPGEDYVLLAVGRDYADVSPMRGVLHGGADHTLDVGVTVMPFDEAPDLLSK